jgi:hypothetical protein
LIAASAAEFSNITRRNFMANWRSGSSQWWMDLRGGKWFHDESILQEISRLRQFAEQHVDDRNSIAQIAVFVSDRNMSFQRQLPVALSKILVEHPLNELSTIGAPFDLLRLEDIPLMAKTGKLDHYRLCVFLNAFEVSERIRKHIDSTLKKDNRTLVWSYLPGVINNGRFDLKAAEELTGMRYALIKGMFRDSMITEYWQNGHRFTYGSERNIFPRLTGIDPEAETQGYYVEGTQYVRPGFGTDEQTATGLEVYLE